jgi:hypothetical protein
MKEERIAKLYAELLKHKYVICDSPAVRFYIYKQLKIDGIEFSTEKIGDTGPGRLMCKYLGKNSIGYSAKRLVKWIRLGRVYEEELVDGFNNFLKSKYYCGDITEEDVRALFDKDGDKEQNFIVLDKMCKPYCKYGIFDWIRLHKLIKKITIE